MSSTWIFRRPGMAGAPLRLYTFAHAGGSASTFLTWQGALGSRIEICAVQLPGRGMRLAEPPRSSMKELVHDIAAAMVREARGNFAMLGHSLGGLLAFEVAHELRRLGARMPSRLLVSGCAAPRDRRPRPRLHELDDVQFREALARYKGTPPELLQHAELMDLARPALRADFQLVCEYQYAERQPLAVPLAVLAARDDDMATPDEMAGWPGETSAGCSIHWFDCGGHFFIESQRAAVQACVIEQLSGLVCA